MTFRRKCATWAYLFFAGVLPLRMLTAQIGQATSPPGIDQVKLTVLNGPAEGSPLGYTVAQVFKGCNQANNIGVAMSRAGTVPGAGEFLQTGTFNAAGAKPYSTWDGNHLYVNWVSDHTSSGKPISEIAVRIDLGSNLAFADGTHTHTETIPPKSQFSLMYFRQGGSVSTMCDTTGGKGTESISLADTRPIACPHLQEVRDGVREINGVAKRLDTDDAFYQSAVGDMLVRGYNSEFARYALNIEESMIPQIFANDQYIRQNKDRIIQRVQFTAGIRQQLATAMFARQQGQTYQPPSSLSNIINAHVATYLCTADPAQMDIASWDALYGAGYIPYPLHKDVKAKMQTNAVVGPIVMAASIIDVAPLAIGIVRSGLLAGGRVAIDSGGIAILKRLAGGARSAEGALAYEAPRALTTIYRRFTADDVNALFRGFYPPFWKEASAFEAATNETTELVRFFRVFKNDKGELISTKVGSWAVRRELIIDEEGNFLPAKVIQDRLGLEFPPTHVTDVTVPPNTKFIVGTSAPQPQWGVAGKTEQFYIEDTGALKYGQDIALTK